MNDKTLTLSLDPELAPGDAAKVLTDIRALAGVSQADLLAPDAKNRVARSIAYVKLHPQSDTAEAAKKVAAVPGVVSCEVAPTRRLI
jgi:hypothetical protein